MQAYAEDAVDLAHEQFETDLDYSEASVQKVEMILATLHNSLPKGWLSRLLRRGPSDENVRQMARIWGGYVGEVMRRQWGGEWVTETEAQPGIVLTLRIGSTDLFPPAKVYKQLINGPADSVWFYYQVLKKDMAKRYEGGRE